MDKYGVLEDDLNSDLIHHHESLKACKIEDESLADSDETAFGLFASLLDTYVQGSIPEFQLVLDA